jgi:hypothetical protein
MGRTRSHDIHLRLDDQEFNKLNEMVSKSIYSREKYIRMVLLEKKQILETPKTYLQFAADLRRLGTELGFFKWTQGLTEDERDRLMELSGEVFRLVGKLDDEYFYRDAKSYRGCPGDNKERMDV